jgi:hypothetical protein
MSYKHGIIGIKRAFVYPKINKSTKLTTDSTKKGEES